MVFGCARKTPRGSFPCGVPLCGHFPGRWGCNSPLTTICDSDFPKFVAAVNLRSVKPLMSRVALVLVFFVIALGTMSSAQTVTLVLQEDVSSKLSTGTTFTAKDSAGKIYLSRGHTSCAAISSEGFDELGIRRPCVAGNTRTRKMYFAPETGCSC